MRDVTLVILNSLRIKCHIRRPLRTLEKTQRNVRFRGARSQSASLAVPSVHPGHN